MSPAINGFSSEVPIQALAVRLRRLELMKNRRSGLYYSMNHPSEWVPHRAFKRYCGSQKIVEVVVFNKIFRHSMTVHHSALLFIAIAQAYLKLENTWPLRSSHKPQPFRSYQENIACWLVSSIISDSIISASGSIQEAAPHVSELLCYVD